MRFHFSKLAVALFTLVSSHGAEPDSVPERFRRVEVEVDGVTRRALVYPPKTAGQTLTPLVFVFHGHGGTAYGAVRSFAMDRHWPEAISVYMQGLNTPGRLTDPEGKRPGWQHAAGDHQDRDLKFFDALLAKLSADYRVDAQRIYSTGHSNGGAFTYLLWAERGDAFAALAPSGSAAAQIAPKLKPKPAMHIAGETDPLVKFEWQRMTMQRLRTLNGCGPEGEPWGEHCTLYPSNGDTPLLTFIHPGGHEFPQDSVPKIVKFFQQHTR